MRTRGTGVRGWQTTFAQERLLGLVIASALCLALELFCEWHYDTKAYRFLLWNLMLAWIPLLLGVLIYLRWRRGASILELGLIIAMWLLFLPNAPYVATDLMHLQRTPATPLWVDGAMLAGFACTGMVLGLESVHLVHAVVRQRRGALAGWCSVVVVLSLASAGIFLGRFLRWNSWDVLVRPGERLAQLMSHLSDPSAVARAAAVTLVLTSLLTIAYSCFYVLLRVRLKVDGALNANRAPRRF